MKLDVLDKVGAFGAFFAAGACPACFPLLAIVGSVLGLSFLKPYEGLIMVVFQILVALALIGNIASFFQHRKIWLLALGILSPGLIFFAFYIQFSTAILNTGLFGLIVTAVLNFIEKKKCKSCEMTSK